MIWPDLLSRFLGVRYPIGSRNLPTRRSLVKHGRSFFNMSYVVEVFKRVREKLRKRPRLHGALKAILFFIDRALIKTGEIVWKILFFTLAFGSTVHSCQRARQSVPADLAHLLRLLTRYGRYPWFVGCSFYWRCLYAT